MHFEATGIRILTFGSEIRRDEEMQLERMIRGLLGKGWVFDTSPLEIATRVLCIRWRLLPTVARKLSRLSLSIVLTYMGRIIYFLIRWSRATFDDANAERLQRNQC